MANSAGESNDGALRLDVDRRLMLQFRGSVVSAVQLQLHALAYNLGNFLRTLATPEPIKDWSLTSLQEKLIKIGAKIVSHGRSVAFQMAEVAIPKNLFADILRIIPNFDRRLIQRLRELFGRHAFEPNSQERCVLSTINSKMSGTLRNLMDRREFKPSK